VSDAPVHHPITMTFSGLSPTEKAVDLRDVLNSPFRAGLSHLLIALGDALSHEVEVTVPGGARLSRSLPIAVYLTGLPTSRARPRRRGATFARRFKTTTLTAIEAQPSRGHLPTPGHRARHHRARTALHVPSPRR
jgi:hypothetical protein